MADDRVKQQFLDQFNRLFGEGAAGIGRELQDQLKAAINSTLEKMDLVTRDEFEAQKAVLARSRELLHRLERQLAELEAEVSKRESDPD